MDKEELKHRTKLFALRIIKLCATLAHGPLTHQIMAKQLMRCGTSVGANYRESCLAKSTADFINKLKICEAEADEACYWLELLQESGAVAPYLLQPLYEARQLTSIMAASILSLKRK